MDCSNAYHKRKYPAVALLVSVRRDDATRVRAEGPRCYDDIVNEIRYWPDRWEVVPLPDDDAAAAVAEDAEGAVVHALSYGGVVPAFTS